MRVCSSALVVAAADELLLAWLDGQQNLAREDVIRLVVLIFDAVTGRIE